MYGNIKEIETKAPRGRRYGVEIGTERFHVHCVYGKFGAEDLILTLYNENNKVIVKVAKEDVSSITICKSLGDDNYWTVSSTVYLKDY